MADLFSGGDGEMSIADMVRQAALEVCHSRVPPGFEWIEEYKQYYSHSSDFFYDPTTNLFFHNESQTYYVFNETTKTYEIYRCMQKVEWSNRKFERRAHALYGEDYCKVTQDTADICEVLFSVVDSVASGHFYRESLARLEKLRGRPKNRREKRDRIRKKRNYIDTEDPDLCIYQEEDEYDYDYDEPSGSDVSTWYNAYEFTHTKADRKKKMDDEGFSNPPLLRIIDDKNQLHITTICGAVVGTGEDVDIRIGDHSAPPKVLELVYVSEASTYVIRKLAKKCHVQLNDYDLQMGDDKEVVHGDFLKIGKSKLLIHVHYGNNTCNGCEAGLLKPINNVTKTVSGETSRRRTLKMLKAAYGTSEKPAHVSKATKDDYEDRAAKRRKEVGSEIDIKKQRPSMPQSANPNDVYANCLAKPVPGAMIPEKPKPKPDNLTAENKGFKLLKGMGWKEGEGLGKANTGRVEPVINEVKVNRAGLGSGVSGAVKPPPPNSKDAILDVTRKRYEEIDRAQK